MDSKFKGTASVNAFIGDGRVSLSQRPLTPETAEQAGRVAASRSMRFAYEEAKRQQVLGAQRSGT